MMSSFADRLRAERKRIGLNQSDFAALGGVSRNSQVDYERGASSPTVQYLSALQPHGVDICYLVTGAHSISELTDVEGQLIAAFRSLDAERQAHTLAGVRLMQPLTQALRQP